jgi:predicted methyltransferase
MRATFVAVLFVVSSALPGCSKSKDAAPTTPPAEAMGSAAPAMAAPAEGSAAPAMTASANPSAGASAGAAGPGATAAPAAPTPPAPIVIPPYNPPADAPEPVRAAVTAADRSDADRALDAGRKPAEMLAFFKIAPGQQVAEIFAGRGYTSELVARVVGDTGKVYAQNTQLVLERFARGPLTERTTKPWGKPIVIVEQPAETPVPAEVKNLDAVLCVLEYHDLAWLKVDRAKFNASVFAALKPGGIYGIVDHRAAQGSGTRDSQTLHRIDEDTVKQEVLAAGFKLDGESAALANPDDAHDWNASPGAATALDKRGQSDRFTLRFVKPGGKAKPARSPKPSKPAKK